MTQWLLRWGRRAWLSLAVMLVVLALLLSALRGALLIASEHQQALLIWLFKDNAPALSTQRFNAKINNFRPSLVLEKVEITLPSAKDYRFEIGELLLELNLWRSLREMQPIFDHVVLDNSRITLPLAIDKQASNRLDFYTAQQAFADAFLRRMEQFTLNNSELTLLLPNKALIVDVQTLVWQNQGELHQGNGRIALPEQNSRSELQVRIDITGDSRDIAGLEAKFYAKGEKLNLAILKNLFDSQALSSLESDLNLELWGELGAKRKGKWLLQWQPSFVQWQTQKERSTHRFELHSGQLRATQLAAGRWRLDKGPWQFSQDGKALDDFSLQALAQSQHVKLAINDWHIAQWTPWLRLFEVSSPWADSLKGGRLTSAELEYQRIENKPQLSYRAKLDAIELEAKGNIPRLEQAKLTLEGKNTELKAHLYQQGGALQFAPQFDKPLTIDALDMQVHLSAAPEGMRLRSTYTQLNTPHAALTGQWMLDLRHARSPLLSMNAALSLPDVANIASYYPKIMPSGLNHYLSQALKGGHVAQGNLLWFGELNAFPYTQGKGIFQAHLPLQNANFVFDPAWSPLENIDLSLLFENDSLLIEGENSRLAGIDLHRVRAAIPRYQDQDLSIELLLSGRVERLQRYLANTPVEGLQQSMTALELANNRISGQLNLSIPFDERPIDVRGYVDFDNNDLLIKPIALQLKDINGRLYFENAQLKGSELRATLHNLPLSFQLQTNDNENHYGVDLGLKAKWPYADMPALNAHLPEVTGHVDWHGQLNLQLANQDVAYQATLLSDLKDTALNLPMPLSKQTAQLWPSVLSLNGSSEGGELVLEIADTLQGSALYHIDNAKLHVDSVQLHGGRGLGPEGMASGLALSGNYPKLDLNAWLQWWQNRASASLFDTQAKDDAATFMLPKLERVSLVADELHFSQQTLSKLDISYFDKRAQQWQLKSTELQGQLRLPSEASDDTTWHIDVDYAQLDDLSLPQPASESASSLRAFDLPPFILTCQACLFGTLNLASLQLALPKAVNGQREGRMRIDWGHSALEGRISASEKYSELKGRFDSKSIQHLLAELGYVSPLAKTPAKLDYVLRWQNDLLAFERNSLEGEMHFDGGEGVISEVSDRGTRFFALASLDTIQRRLRLDFSDVFDKGIHYDDIQASINIKNGVAKNDDFFINGVAGAMRGQGELDIRTGELDYKVSYAPKLTSSLPVLTAFLATPVTGVAVLALQKVLEPVVEVITRVDFTLKGNISEPQLIEMKQLKQEIEVPERFR